MSNRKNLRFNRGLSEEFVKDLADGRLRFLLRDVTDRDDLDLQLRENYLDVYHGGQRVLNLRPCKGSYRAEIAKKYLVGIDLPVVRCKGDNARFEATDDFIAQYRKGLDAICDNAAQKFKSQREGWVEANLVRDCFAAGSCVAFIDRQIQVHGETNRADLAGLVRPRNGPFRFVIAELKVRNRWVSKNLAGQMQRYMKTFATPELRIAPDVRTAYARVLDQKYRLGLLTERLTLPHGGLPVEPLFILYDCSSRSSNLRTLRRQALGAGLHAKVVQLAADCFTLQPWEEWEEL